MIEDADDTLSDFKVQPLPTLRLLTRRPTMPPPLLRPAVNRPLLLEPKVAFSSPFILALLLVFFFILPPQDSSIITPAPLPAPSPTDSSRTRQEAIEAAFDFAWDGYYKFAFPHDELKPSSNTPGFSRNDWGATAVDALGTAILMGRKEVVRIVLEHVRLIDFKHTTTRIAVFECTIRYLGGLMSAYDLLTGPFKSLVPEDVDMQVLVEQATNLADVLSNSFDEGDLLPSGLLDPNTYAGSKENTLAGVGTLVG